MATVELSAQSVYKKFGSQEVIKNVSVTFSIGTSYALVGSSGTGKSTLLHMLAGLDRPSVGAVLLDRCDIYSLSSKDQSKLLNQRIGLVFQNPYLIYELSVIENIMMPGLIAGQRYAACAVKAKALLVRIGLQDKAFACPALLSGGQQQRVAIARALFNEPDFLLADEPTGNLDEKTGKCIIDFLRECQQEWHMGMIISSHDAYVAQSMDHVYCLKDGQLILD